MSELVLYRVEGSSAHIVLNRPEKRNALSRALIEALSQAFSRAESDPAARSIVLTGNGSAFCAGMDLDELQLTLSVNTDPQVVWEDAHRLSSLYQKIYHSPKPTIAMVNGAAVAGGAGLMTVCDLAISVPAARIGYPEVRRGLVAAMVMPHLLRHVGERAARWLLLTGELIDGIQALRVGLVNQVAEQTQIQGVVDDWCSALAAGGPQALSTTKQLLAMCSRQSLSVEDLCKASAEPRLGDECRGGLSAFFAKEPAPWQK